MRERWIKINSAYEDAKQKGECAEGDFKETFSQDEIVSLICTEDYLTIFWDMHLSPHQRQQQRDDMKHFPQCTASNRIFCIGGHVGQ